MMAKNRALFLLPKFWTSSIPWLVVGLGFLVSDVTSRGSFFIGESLVAFRLLLVFLGGLGVVGLPPVFTPSSFLYPYQKYRQ